MSEDILHQIRITSRNYDVEMNEEIHNRALLLIEDICYLMCGSLLIRLGMPAPNREMNDAFNRELEREREYDQQELDLVVQTNVPLLNSQQKEVYDTLMKAIDDGNGGLYFLDAPGGTGHCSCEIQHSGCSCFFWNSSHIVRRMPYGSFSIKITVKPSNY
ncbi:unnamed protein product [Arctia plantaginis]|uniref:ATP-dependent DNA helicase n=1 Tax=Arctia plantaginis TaxID=874455 RepID=A0A8S0ZCF8_ARCPL|nr:unnamed protein product [Arctia plantaginis]